MRVAIVDDEYYALQGLKMELQDIGGFEVAGIYEDGAMFLAEAERIRPDVVFLDIEMPVMDGFQVLERLMETGLTPQIVFVTAFSQYAVKAFEVNALDYVVKPVTKERLLKALQKVKVVNQWEGEPQRIHVNCFRSFSIKANGTEFNTGWRTKKAEELLAYLIAEKGRFVSKEKIAEALWPELDGEKSLSNLHLAFYYIKKQVLSKGIHLPIESVRGKMRIRVEELECDLLQFEELAAASQSKGISDSEAFDLMERAVELYRGELFEEQYYDWALELQQKYSIQYGRMIRRLEERYGSLKK